MKKTKTKLLPLRAAIVLYYGPKKQDRQGCISLKARIATVKQFRGLQQVPLVSLRRNVEFKPQVAAAIGKLTGGALKVKRGRICQHSPTFDLPEGADRNFTVVFSLRLSKKELNKKNKAGGQAFSGIHSKGQEESSIMMFTVREMMGDLGDYLTRGVIATALGG